MIEGTEGMMDERRKRLRNELMDGEEGRIEWWMEERRKEYK